MPELKDFESPTTLVDCGCEAKVYLDRSGVEIIYCPLHQAAPKLLDACKMAVTRLTEVDSFAHRSFILLDELGCSVTKGYVNEAIADATRTP